MEVIQQGFFYQPFFAIFELNRQTVQNLPSLFKEIQSN